MEKRPQKYKKLARPRSLDTQAARPTTCTEQTVLDNVGRPRLFWNTFFWHRRIDGPRFGTTRSFLALTPVKHQ